MNWQSPKFFAYYPCNINSTILLSEMFTGVFAALSVDHTNAPCLNELENVMLDWAAKAMSLPSKFLLNNTGGGMLNGGASESMLLSIHVAKSKKMKKLNIEGNDPRSLKLVGYYGEGSHDASHRGLQIKDIYHQRSIPYFYDERIQNYRLNLDRLEQMLK